MAKTLSISEVCFRLPELICGVESRDEDIVVMQGGKPAAVLVSYIEYELLKETMRMLTRPDLVRRFREMQESPSPEGEVLPAERVPGGQSTQDS